MKPKQTLLFLFLNILGTASLAVSLYFYLLKENLIALISLAVGLLMIIISFRVGLKVDRLVESNWVDGSINDEPEIEIVPVAQMELIEQTSPQVTTELDDEPLQAVFEDKNLKELLSHYLRYENNQDPNTITTHVDTIEMLASNIKSLSDKMDTYGLVKKNPLFNYRFEALLKQGVTNTKVWENLYETIPYVDIVEQHVDTMNRSVYLVRASINERTRTNIGYLPFNVNLSLVDINSIEGTLIGGNYNYLNAEDSSFKTHDEPIKLHIMIQKK